MLRGLLFVVAVFVMVGCDAIPTQRFALGQQLADIDFSQSFMWQQYVHPEQHVDFEITAHDSYEAKAWDGGFMWTIQPPQETDTVIDVTTTQLSSYDNNAYGVMCRALPTDNGDGYYFLISGDGQYSIRRGAQTQVPPLIPFTPSGAINQHQGSINQIRAVCIGSYLALYVNGQFVAETHDDLFTAGYTGLSVAEVKGSDASADIVYNDLKVSAASLIPQNAASTDTQ